MRHTKLLPLTILLLASGCTQPAATPATPAKPDTPTSPAIAANPINEQIRSIASSYKSWTRVSDRPNYAPTDCFAPPPNGAQVSDAPANQAAHGQKLYYLFARNADEYPFFGYGRWYDDNGNVANDIKSRTQPIGQVVVKQSFHAIPSTEDQAHGAMTAQDRFERRDIAGTFARDWVGQQLFSYARIGEPSGLFIMLKVDPATPDTDNGWIYATTSPTGEVTSSGRVVSCMGCHINAPYDRLFGPKNLKRGRSPSPAGLSDERWQVVPK